MGMGVDVHGGDYTKAGRRAVFDALRHSSLNFFQAAGKTKEQMQIEVRVAVQKPDAGGTSSSAGASSIPRSTSRGLRSPTPCPNSPPNDCPSAPRSSTSGPVVACSRPR